MPNDYFSLQILCSNLVPINKEITQITKTLMTTNSHLKSELQRHKRKLKEAHTEILKLKQAPVETILQQAQQQTPSTPESGTSSASVNDDSGVPGPPSAESELIKELKAQVK